MWNSDVVDEESEDDDSNDSNADNDEEEERRRCRGRQGLLTLKVVSDKDTFLLQRKDVVVKPKLAADKVQLSPRSQGGAAVRHSLVDDKAHINHQRKDAVTHSVTDDKGRPQSGAKLHMISGKDPSAGKSNVGGDKGDRLHLRPSALKPTTTRIVDDKDRRQSPVRHNIFADKDRLMHQRTQSPVSAKAAPLHQRMQSPVSASLRHQSPAAKDDVTKDKEKPRQSALKNNDAKDTAQLQLRTQNPVSKHTAIVDNVVCNKDGESRHSAAKNILVDDKVRFRAADDKANKTCTVVVDDDKDHRRSIDKNSVVDDKVKFRVVDDKDRRKDGDSKVGLAAAAGDEEIESMLDVWKRKRTLKSER